MVSGGKNRECYYSIHLFSLREILYENKCLLHLSDYYCSKHHLSKPMIGKNSSQVPHFISTNQLIWFYFINQSPLCFGSPCCWIPVQGFFNCIDFLRVFRCFLFIRLAAQRKRFFVDSHFNVETLGCISLLYLGI